MMSAYRITLGFAVLIEVQYTMSGFLQTVYYRDGDRFTDMPHGITLCPKTGRIEQAVNRSKLGIHAIGCHLSRVAS